MFTVINYRKIELYNTLFINMQVNYYPSVIFMYHIFKMLQLLILEIKYYQLRNKTALSKITFRLHTVW